MGNLLSQLGINHSFLFQFVIFMVAYGVLSHFLFKPYLKILRKREQNTLGGQAEVTILVEKEERIYQIYKNKLQDLHQQIKALFQKEEQSAKKTCQTKLQEAQQKRQQQLTDLQIRLKEQLREEEAKVGEEAQKLTTALTNKLME